MKQAFFPLALVALAGCEPAGPGGGLRTDDTTFTATVNGEEISAETIDGTASADAAVMDGEGEAAGEGEPTFIGFTVISLGDATDPGLWLETPLVVEEQPGRVIGEDGRVVFVTLRPSGGETGSGSRLSLQGYQVLGIALTALPTVTVTTVN
jgi:hypothetical protein